MRANGPVQRGVGQPLTRAQSLAPSLDHLVRSEQQRWRDRQTERLGGLDVDDQLKLYRRLDGKLVGRRPLEDAIGIGRRALKIIEQVIPVGQQPAQFSEITKRIDGRKTVASSQ